MHARRWLLVLLLAIPGACARTRPATAPPPPTPTAVARLQQELAAAFDNPSVNALWAVQVQSFDTGEVLFERNAHTLVMPASNMKLLTMSVAATRLGWDFKFSTQIATDGTIQDGVLTGDLIIVGNGDPTINDRGGDATRVFQSWADRLRAQGVTRITGRIVGDDDLLDDQPLGAGWAWDDLVYGYSTAGGALQFNENVVKVLIHPAATAGEPATVTLEPAGSGLIVHDNVTTADATTTADVSLARKPGRPALEVFGTIPLGGRDVTQTAAVENPTQFYVNVLRDVLIRKGIAVDGAAMDIDDLPVTDAAAVDQRRVLFTHQSPPLASAELGMTFMKVSQNLYGETLMETIGALGQPPNADGRHHHTEAARKIYEDVLSSWGIPPAEHIIVDGSGLSRYNYVTASLIVHILRAMARDPTNAATFEALLPIAGKDGTLRNRMKGTKAEGNVHAKTGTLSSVRSLSGYLRTADGERLGFSIIANNFKAPSAIVDGIAELAVERLSNFSRGGPASTPAPAAPPPAGR